MKVGLIRCLQTEDMCPATTCIKAMDKKVLAFKGIEEDIELIGVNTCGGCPGKKAVTRAAKWSAGVPTPLRSHPASPEAIQLASPVRMPSR